MTDEHVEETTTDEILEQIHSEIASHLSTAPTQEKVFRLLADRKWHCRSCEGAAVASEQYAGGGGIQGLQRGTRRRPGLEIERKTELCPRCSKRTTWDRWTGRTRGAAAAAHIPPKLRDRILALYDYADSIEQRQRPAQELVIDHRFPMQRWGASEPRLDPDMSGDEIRAKFQLLKKDAAGNHNLLKSRACERCLRTGARGTPFGIRFWYQGGPEWSPEMPAVGQDAEPGCFGCGWYNFARWREALNQALETLEPERPVTPSQPPESQHG